MTNNLTPRPEVRGAIVGVDTHKHIHVAVAIDTCGIHLGDQSFAADSGGYQAVGLEFVIRPPLEAGPWPRQWEIQRTWLNSARAAVRSPAKPNGV